MAQLASPHLCQSLCLYGSWFHHMFCTVFCSSLLYLTTLASVEPTHPILPNFPYLSSFVLSGFCYFYFCCCDDPFSLNPSYFCFWSASFSFCHTSSPFFWAEFIPFLWTNITSSAFIILTPIYSGSGLISIFFYLHPLAV